MSIYINFMLSKLLVICIFVYNICFKWNLFNFRDGDGILDFKDNCLEVLNVQQIDIDSDSTGDFCDFDIDNDGVFNVVDNCVYVVNVDQVDINGNINNVIVLCVFI